MAHYDDDTKKFIEDVSKQALGVARDVSRGHHPVSAIARRALSTTQKRMMEKDASSINPLATYEKLTEQLGDEWTDWEPETLWGTLGSLDDEQRNLIQALQVIAKTNFPFEDWNVFENVSHAINGNQVHFDEIQPSELDEIAWTIKVLRTIRPNTEFSSEVCGYIAACAKHAGVVILPSDFFPAESQELLDGIGNNTELKNNLIGEAGRVQIAKLKEIKEFVDNHS